MKPNRIRTRAFRLAVAAGIAALALVFGSASAASAASPGDPQATGCATGATTIWQNTYLGYGTVEVRYSPACGTNWVRISGATGRPSEAGIYSAASGWVYSPSYGSSPSQYWTWMVSAPGTACITFYAKIVNGSGTLLNTGNITLC